MMIANPRSPSRSFHPAGSFVKMIRIGVTYVTLMAASGLPVYAATPEQTAIEVLAKTPIIDGHNDTPEQIREIFGNDFSKFDLMNLPPEVVAKTHTTIPKLREGHVGGQFWSVWVDAALPKHEAVVTVLEQIDTVERMVARYPETFQMARTSTEVEAAMKKGKIA